MSPELLDTIQASPLTPWVGGAILLFLAFTLIKFIAQTIGKLIITAVIGVVGFLGWNWWGEQEPRDYAVIGQDWFQSLKKTDFSKSSVQALVQDTRKLLKEATDASQSKGQEMTKNALAQMAESLKQKMQEAGSQGQEEAKLEIEKLRDTVMARLK